MARSGLAVRTASSLTTSRPPRVAAVSVFSRADLYRRLRARDRAVIARRSDRWSRRLCDRAAAPSRHSLRLPRSSSARGRAAAPRPSLRCDDQVTLTPVATRSFQGGAQRIYSDVHPPAERRGPRDEVEAYAIVQSDRLTASDRSRSGHRSRVAGTAAWFSAASPRSPHACAPGGWSVERVSRAIGRHLVRVAQARRASARTAMAIRCSSDHWRRPRRSFPNVNAP